MDLRAYLLERTPLVEQALEAALPASDAPPERLHAAMRHLVFPGGKRLRPIFVLAGAEAVAASPERALPAAVNLPALLRIDTGEKVILSRLDDGTVRTSKIASSSSVGAALVMQGNDDGRPWAMRVNTEKGNFTLGVLREDETFTAFGVCSATILE